jgi:dTDP-4-amino-4,6-dideoxygalactose transaminase
VVAWLGASPVFADIDPLTFCLDPTSVEQGIATAKAAGLTPRGIIAVDLFGHPADYDVLLPLAASHGLWLMDDAAQGFGATYGGRKLGTFGDFTATSFFPAKPLGCYGDGGAVFFEDDAMVEVLLSLRVHGQGADKYDNVRIGMNGRMDTVQCAVVLEKLRIFEDEIAARNRVATRYGKALSDLVQVPTVAAGCTSIWAQYTVVLPRGVDRDGLQKRLVAEGVPTAVYYGKAMHHQTAYRHFPVAGNGLPVAEDYARRVLSLPMHAYLDEATQDRIVTAFRTALGR